MKALGGINPVRNNTEKTEEAATATQPAPENNAQQPVQQEKYNPMAEIIERHENAVNRLKRGK